MADTVLTMGLELMKSCVRSVCAVCWEGTQSYLLPNTSVFVYIHACVGVLPGVATVPALEKWRKQEFLCELLSPLLAVL